MGIIIRSISQWSFKIRHKNSVFYSFSILLVHFSVFFSTWSSYILAPPFIICCHSLPLTLAVLLQLYGRPLPVSVLSDVLIPGSCRPSCLPPAMLWTCAVSEPCVQMESFCSLTLLAVDETRDARAAYWTSAQQNKWNESTVCMYLYVHIL